MTEKRNFASWCVFNVIIFTMFLVFQVYAADDFRGEFTKSAYKAGDNITATFYIRNSGDKKKTYRVVLECSNPVNGHPGCREVYIEVEPGESKTGTIDEYTEFKADTEAHLKIIDLESDEILFMENKSIKVMDPAEIVCGDGVCNEAAEDYLTCALDCEKRPECGDGVCSSGEEGVCSSDCISSTSTTKPKQQHEEGNATPLFIVGVVVFVVAAVCGFFIWRKAENKRIEKKREEFEKWRKDQEALR